MHLPAHHGEELATWRRRGGFLELGPFAHRVFFVDLGEPNAPAEKTLLLLHGFPESSFSYSKVIDGLRDRFARVIAFDLLGFGLSDKPVDTYSYSLFEQADLALQVWAKLGVTGGHLLAHDMGDSIATELAARHTTGVLPGFLTDGLLSYTFTNGSMVLELADLRVSQRLLLGPAGFLLGSLATFRVFRSQVRSAHGDDTLGLRDIELMWENVLLQDGNRKNHRIIQYLAERKRFEAIRWLPAVHRLPVPIHLCWGANDRVARLDIAQYLKQRVCPEAKLSVIEGAGHFCQLGTPQPWLEAVTAFYAALP